MFTTYGKVWVAALTASHTFSVELLTWLVGSRQGAVAATTAVVLVVCLTCFPSKHFS